MDKDIQEMKCFVFRIAQKRWNISPQKCAEIFDQCKVYDFIQECYDILHLSGYECVVNDIENIMRTQGITI